MRVIVIWDRFWSCNVLALDILRRLVARHGPGLVIVHGGGTGTDRSFADACKGLGIVTEVHPLSDEDAGPVAIARTVLVRREPVAGDRGQHADDRPRPVGPSQLGAVDEPQLRLARIPAPEDAEERQAAGAATGARGGLG
jgi:hypothetical protein